MTILTRLRTRLAASRDSQLSTSWLRDQQRREDSAGREECPAWDWDAIKQAARDATHATVEEEQHR